MIRQFLSLLAGLLLSSYPLVAMESPCIICNNRLPAIARELPVTLNCHHSYHPTCIHTWSQTNPSCPHCRHPISPEQIAYFEFAANDHEESHNMPQNIIQHKKLQILFICGVVAVVLYLSKDKILSWFSDKKNNIDFDLEPEGAA